MQFVPDDDKSGLYEIISVPFFEEARADFAPFYRTRMTLKQAMKEVEKNFSKLGAGVRNFHSGKFIVNDVTRFGYQITFNFRGATGLLVVAALPIKSHTQAKEQQARIQSLMNVAQWLQTQVTQVVFSPGSNPLLPYLLTGEGKTIMQHILESKAFPQLSASQDIVDAEIED